VGGDELAPKYKSLIGLAVAAQIPCKYCVVADTEFARADGASEAEVGEAVAMAALVRQWSTWLNGTQSNEPAFRKDIDALVKGAKKAQKQASLE
jgi:AhpD family alkylhydroperoxidase